MELYKIRERESGKFSTGGSNPRFTRSGKSWDLGNLRRHMSLIADRHKEYYNHYCELVVFEDEKVISFSDI